MKDRSPIGPHEVVDHAIVTRQSIRAFLSTPVLRATIEEILAIAARAPSGTNTQPWKVTVLYRGCSGPAQHGDRRGV